MVRFKSAVQLFTRAIAFVAMLLLLPMMFLSAADVCLRKLAGTTIPGTMELSSYMLALFILLGLSYTHQCRAHVRVSFLLNRLPEKVKSLVELLLSLLCLAMLFTLVVEGWLVAWEETTVSDMLRIPETPFRLALVVGCFSFALELAVDIIDHFHHLRGR